MAKKIGRPSRPANLAQARRLTDLREAAGLTQTELADRLGVDRSTVNHWESGRRQPGMDRLPALAAALGVAVGELFPKSPPA